MSIKKIITSFNFLLALINNSNPTFSEQQEQQILQQEGVVGIEDGYVILESKVLDCKMPNGEIIQVPITQDLLDEAIEYFIKENEMEIKGKLLDQLNKQLPKQ